MKMCELCKIREATKTNSHIYPYFAGKSLLITKENKRKIYSISSLGLNKRPSQDTPKEDFIFCPECESLIDREYESPFARYFYFEKENPRKFFNVIIRGHISYRVYHSMNYEKYNLLVYTLLFRASISNHDIFKDFKIKDDLQEELRNIILKKSKFKNYSFFTLYCPENSYPSLNLISAVNRGGIYMLNMNEFIFIFDFSSNKLLHSKMSNVEILNYPNVRIVTMPFKYWWSWNRDFVVDGLSQIIEKKENIAQIINDLLQNRTITLE